MILITAPTSNIGSQVIADLLDNGQTLRVIARDPSKLPGEVRDRVEVIEGSHGDAAVIDAASEGIQAAFWLTPNLPDAETLQASFVDFARPAADAFARHGVKRVVGISAVGRDAPQAQHAGSVTASLEMDDLFAASAFAYRAVVSPSFMDNLLRHAGPIKEQGKFLMTLDPQLKAPTVATRDIAATAARLLIDTSWDGSDEVACLGPEDLSFEEQAKIISDVLGKEVSYVQIPFSAFKDRMIGFGMSEAMTQGLVDMFEAKNDGLDNTAQRTEQSTTPTSFRQWVQDVLKPAIEAA
jgi:uncharacterized protein YbjT (DUF2867 family)